MPCPAARPIALEWIRRERNQNLRETAIKVLGQVGIHEDLELLRTIADGETNEPARFAKDARRRAYGRLASRLGATSTISKPTRLRARISKAMRYEVLKRDGHRCVRCGRSSHEGAKLEVDRIVHTRVTAATFSTIIKPSATTVIKEREIGTVPTCGRRSAAFV